MDCTEAQLRISKDIDGELPVEHRVELEQHLRDCPKCRRFASRCESLQDAVAALAGAHPPDQGGDDMRKRLWREAEDGGALGGRLRFYRRLSYLAVAACVALVAGLVFQSLAHEKSLPEPGASRPERALSGAMRTAEQVSEAVLSPADAGFLAEQRQAFAAVTDYLGGSLRWMVQDGDQTELGMVNNSGEVGARATAGPLMLELRVVRDAGRGCPQVVSAPTLTLMPGTEAVFTLDPTVGGRGERYSYRCRAERRNGSVVCASVELTVRDSAGPQLAMAGTAFLQPGRSAPVAWAAAGEGGYLLYALVPPTGTANDGSEGI